MIIRPDSFSICGIVGSDCILTFKRGIPIRDKYTGVILEHTVSPVIEHSPTYRQKYGLRYTPSRIVLDPRDPSSVFVDDHA